MGLRRSGGSANSSTVSSSTSGPGGRGGTTARSSSGTPSARSTVIRRVSTPVSRPLLSLGGLLGSNSFHTEYREQMSPSWWLGAAACSSSWLQLSPPPEVMELVEKKKLTEQFKTVEGLIDRAVRLPTILKTHSLYHSGFSVFALESAHWLWLSPCSRLPWNAGL